MGKENRIKRTKSINISFVNRNLVNVIKHKIDIAIIAKAKEKVRTNLLNAFSIFYQCGEMPNA